VSRSVDRPHVGYSKSLDEGWERTFGESALEPILKGLVAVEKCNEAHREFLRLHGKPSLDDWSPDELDAAADNPGLDPDNPEDVERWNGCPHLGAGRDQEHCTRNQRDCPQDDECFSAWVQGAERKTADNKGGKS